MADENDTPPPAPRKTRQRAPQPPPKAPKPARATRSDPADLDQTPDIVEMRNKQLEAAVKERTMTHMGIARGDEGWLETADYLERTTQLNATVSFTNKQTGIALGTLVASQIVDFRDWRAWIEQAADQSRPVTVAWTAKGAQSRFIRSGEIELPARSAMMRMPDQQQPQQPQQQPQQPPPWAPQPPPWYAAPQQIPAGWPWAPPAAFSPPSLPPLSQASGAPAPALSSNPSTQELLEFVKWMMTEQGKAQRAQAMPQAQPVMPPMPSAEDLVRAVVGQLAGHLGAAAPAAPAQVAPQQYIGEMVNTFTTIANALNQLKTVTSTLAPETPAPAVTETPDDDSPHSVIEGPGGIKVVSDKETGSIDAVQTIVTNADKILERGATFASMLFDKIKEGRVAEAEAFAKVRGTAAGASAQPKQIEEAPKNGASEEKVEDLL